MKNETNTRINKIHKTVIGTLLLLITLQFTFHINLSAQDISESSVKSKVTASSIAFAGTAIPVITGLAFVEPVLVLGGLILGPTPGYVYMDELGLGLRYSGVRFLIMGGTVGSVFIICSIGDCSSGLFDSESGSEFDIAMLIIMVGTVSTTIHNLVDVFRVKQRVDSHKNRIAISPTYFPNTKTPGLRAVWKF